MITEVKIYVPGARHAGTDFILWSLRGSGLHAKRISVLEARGGIEVEDQAGVIRRYVGLPFQYTAIEGKEE